MMTKFCNLQIGNFFKSGITYFMVVPAMWIQDNWDSMIKINAVGIFPPKKYICNRCMYFSETTEVEKIDLHELNTILNQIKQCLTFKDLENGDKFLFEDEPSCCVKVNVNSYVLLESGELKYLPKDIEVEKI